MTNIHDLPAPLQLEFAHPILRVQRNVHENMGLSFPSSIRQVFGIRSSIALLILAFIATTPGRLSATTTSAATDCTLYASPSGSSGNSGKIPSSPLTLQVAVNQTQPGSVVCLMSGTYYVDTP